MLRDNIENFLKILFLKFSFLWILQPSRVERLGFAIFSDMKNVWLKFAEIALQIMKNNILKKKSQEATKKKDYIIIKNFRTK